MAFSGTVARSSTPARKPTAPSGTENAKTTWPATDVLPANSAVRVGASSASGNIRFANRRQPVSTARGDAPGIETAETGFFEARLGPFDVVGHTAEFHAVGAGVVDDVAGAGIFVAGLADAADADGVAAIGIEADGPLSRFISLLTPPKIYLLYQISVRV